MFKSIICISAQVYTNVTFCILYFTIDELCE